MDSGIWEVAKSYWSPVVLESARSKYSGPVRAVMSQGDIYISTGGLTQSGGLVKELWEGIIKKQGKKDSSWLILGLAGGTLAGIINRRHPPKKITGVEIDPLMVNMGKKYLGLDKISNLEIVVGDAFRYVEKSADRFDFVIVDMYFGDQLPQFVYDLDFLKKLKKIGRKVIFNHLFYDPPKRAAAGGLVKELEQIFPKINLVRKLTNLLIICESVSK